MVQIKVNIYTHCFVVEFFLGDGVLDANFYSPGREESLSFRARNLSISDLGINQFPSFKSLSYLVRNLTVSELGILQIWKILSCPM